MTRIIWVRGAGHSPDDWLETLLLVGLNLLPYLLRAGFRVDHVESWKPEIEEQF
jgi:hypothetical protein